MIPGPEILHQLVGAEVNPLFGIQTNNLSVTALFDLYERTRFLYPAKRDKLAPVWPTVQSNWQRLRQAGELLLCSMTVEDEATGAISCITKWRTSRFGWQIQHLVSDGNPLGTRAVMTGAIADAYVSGRDRTYQNWFRPDNRFPARVFGTLPAVTEAGQADIHPLRLWNLDRRMTQPACPAGEVHLVRQSSDRTVLGDLTRRSRGPIWAKIEEFDSDMELDSVNHLYNLVGLSRYRRVWAATPRGSDHPAMIAVSYRGPLGMNFSFLENRCELLVDPDADPQAIAALAPALLAHAVTAYRDFELPYIPLVSCGSATRVLTDLGAHWVRDYTQSVWTHEACPTFYHHINNIYERFLSRSKDRP